LLIAGIPYDDKILLKKDATDLSVAIKLIEKFLSRAAQYYCVSDCDWCKFAPKEHNYEFD